MSSPVPEVFCYQGNSKTSTQRRGRTCGESEVGLVRESSAFCISIVCFGCIDRGRSVLLGANYGPIEGGTPPPLALGPVLTQQEQNRVIDSVLLCQFSLLFCVR